jgi:ABC-type lipoprotein export system ATPase subunit
VEELGVSELLHRRPVTLSSGQRARAAIARVVAGGNPIVLADEPTAHLDAANARLVAKLLSDLAAEHRCLVIVATHDPSVAEGADRIVTLRGPGPDA